MTDEIKPIPKAVLRAAVRRLRRSAAAAIMGAMAETDTSFSLMAFRMGRREKTVRRWLMSLADGRRASPKDDLRTIADMATACGCRIDVSLRPVQPSPQGSAGS